MILSVTTEIANALRAIAIGEIFLGIGFLIARLWKRRHHPWQYLSLMAVALLLYSVFAALELAFDKWNKPLSWQAPFILFAATVTFIAVVREGVRKERT